MSRRKAEGLEILIALQLAVPSRQMCIHWLQSWHAKKDVGLRIRLDRGLRDEFVEAF